MRHQFIAMNAISFIFFYCFFLSVNLGPQKRLWQSGKEGNLWADPGGRGSCWPGNPGGKRGNFSGITHFTQVVVHKI